MTECRAPLLTPALERYPWREGTMKGVRFVVDGSGRKVAVQIDLDQQGSLWEDFYDRAIARRRATEPRESLASVKRRLLGPSKQRRRG